VTALDEIQSDNDRWNEVLIGHLTELGVNQSDIWHCGSVCLGCPSPWNITDIVLLKARNKLAAYA
jgi:hypothetical protein